MTTPDAVVTTFVPVEQRHREEAARLTGSNSHNTKRWVETGDFNLLGVSKNTKFYRAVRLSESLANLEAAVRGEYEARIAELEESLEMACQNPADGCDCPGCSYASEVNSTELETLKNG